MSTNHDVTRSGEENVRFVAISEDCSMTRALKRSGSLNNEKERRSPRARLIATELDASGAARLFRQMRHTQVQH